MSGWAYIGVRPCGCVTFAMWLNGYDAPEVIAEEVATVIKSGRHVEYVPGDEAKQRLVTSCSHEGAA